MRIVGASIALGAELLERLHQLPGLLARPRDDDALAEQRPRVEPAQVLAQAGHAADDEHRRVLESRAARACAAARRACRRSSPAPAACRRRRARPTRRPDQPCDSSASTIAGSCSRPGVADDRAAQSRQARPVDVRLARVLVLVPAHERDRVAAARVGDRDARVGRHADRGRDAGHHLERHAVLVQEQRFLAAAVEHERVAPLQARHHLALARLLGEQVADRFLLERLRAPPARRRSARPRAAPAAAGARARGGRRSPRRRGSRHRSPRTVMSHGSPGPAPIR